ncbi:hypothetical protein PI125_g9526 [Phytophthora idaei]|nr:hypothetical protein PI125_g9526 [Phytophthora idaei]
MVVEGMASAITTTTQALPLCPLVGWNHGSTFLVTKTIALLARFPLLRGFLVQLLLVPNTIALSPSFAFFLCLTYPPLFLIGATALTLTLRLLSSKGRSVSMRRARSRWEDVKLARLARALSLSRARVRSCCEADMAAHLRRACSAWRSRRCF